MNNKKEAFEEALNHIFNVISNEQEKKSKKTVQNVLDDLSAAGIEKLNPEEFNLHIGHKVDRGLYELAKALSSTPNSNIENKNKPIFIYLHYDFLEKNIRQLCINREGHACCADKSREIIRMYRKYSLTGEIKVFNPDEENYYTPNFGTNQNWIDYCDGLYDLYYGRTEKYIKAYNTLLHAEIRKYKHMLHRWYIEFNDGETIELTTSWDDDISNPLEDDYYDKGDYYIGYKKLFKHRGFEPCIDDEDTIMSNHFCKIPKSTIKQIYKKSEEVMV